MALQKTYPQSILCAFNELGRKPPLFEVRDFFDNFKEAPKHPGVLFQDLNYWGNL